MPKEVVADSSAVIFLIVSIVVCILIICCCGAIWWDLLDCSSYMVELRQERMIRRHLEKDSTDADPPKALDDDLQTIKITLPTASNADGERSAAIVEPRVTYIVQQH